MKQVEFFQQCKNPQSTVSCKIQVKKPTLTAATITVESSIISIDSNITNKIIRKVIEYEKYRTKDRALRKTSINWIYLQTLFQVLFYNW